MKNYLLALISVHDGAAYKEYSSRALPIALSHGAKILFRGGEFSVVEGEEEATRVVLMEFENSERLETYYYSKDYQEIIPLRERAANSKILMLNSADVSVALKEVGAENMPE